MTTDPKLDRYTLEKAADDLEAAVSWEQVERITQKLRILATSPTQKIIDARIETLLRDIRDYLWPSQTEEWEAMTRHLVDRIDATLAAKLPQETDEVLRERGAKRARESLDASLPQEPAVPEYVVQIELARNAAGGDVLILLDRDPATGTRISGAKAGASTIISRHRCKFTQDELNGANLADAPASGKVAAQSSTGTPRETALADALKLVLDDWANANAIGDDAREQAERALDASVSATGALTERERVTLNNLLTLAGYIEHALEDSEERQDGSTILTNEHANALQLGVAVLDDLPDDQPGYTMDAHTKAAWALRRIVPSDGGGA